ncbi:MAG: hypothetical protein OXI46_01310 [Gemmatimonadota bacterium]|nr:hypothetical protein [Gemmatimonadota bacterium]
MGADTFARPAPPLLAAALAAALSAGALSGQSPDTLAAPSDTAVDARSENALPDPMSPRGAFVRAVLVPGWGHASIGSYARGAFYFAAETVAGVMLARTFRRLSIAKDAQSLEETRLEQALLSVGRPAEDIARLLDDDEAVMDARGLVETRQQQLEDWVALGVFLALLGGADAFVSAHLRDFPAPLTPESRLVPGPAGPVAELGVRVRVGPRRFRPGRR